MHGNSNIKWIYVHEVMTALSSRRFSFKNIDQTSVWCDCGNFILVLLGSWVLQNISLFYLQLQTSFLASLKQDKSFILCLLSRARCSEKEAFSTDKLLPKFRMILLTEWMVM